MARLSPERREQKFAAIRQRQRLLREIREANAVSPPNPETREKPPTEEPPSSWPPHLEMFRVREVAAKLKVSERTVIRWFRDRAVAVGTPRPGHRLKQTLLISRQVLEDWVRENQA